MEELEILKSLLGAYFQYNYYADAVVSVRKEIESNSHYESYWEQVAKLIIYRRLPTGMPLQLIHETANLMLFDNTDEEAYRWLDLFLINVAKKGSVITYEDVGFSQ